MFTLRSTGTTENNPKINYTVFSDVWLMQSDSSIKFVNTFRFVSQLMVCLLCRRTSFGSRLWFLFKIFKTEFSFDGLHFGFGLGSNNHKNIYTSWYIVWNIEVLEMPGKFCSFL